MEIRDLRLVKAIVEEGGVTRASSSLHLSQSALSHQLKELEYRIGAAVFDRVGKKMVPTQAGDALLRLADEILGKIDETRERIRRLAQGEEGRIRISTQCYTSYHWLAPLMRRFCLVHPKIDLDIVMEATHNPLERLLSGDLDLAITSDPVRDDRIRYVKLFRDEMVAVVCDTHPLASKKHLTPEDFADQRLIIHSLPMETVSVHQFFLAPAGVKPAGITVLPLTEAAVEFARADMGVFVMAAWALGPYLERGGLKTVRIGPKGLRRDHFVALLASARPPSSLERFIEFMKLGMSEIGGNAQIAPGS